MHGVGEGGPGGSRAPHPALRGNQNGTKTELKTDRGLEARLHKQIMPGLA